MVSNKTQTEQLMDAMLTRLKEAFGKELMVELFPESPQGYRLNHPRGAVLLAYGKSHFGHSEATDAVFQERNLVIRLTLVFRQLHGKDGVISYLDRLRGCLAGWFPPHCDKACWPVAEHFIGHMNGVWQYAQDFSIRATQIQVVLPGNEPGLNSATFEHEGFP